jgi:hypothetical protein
VKNDPKLACRDKRRRQDVRTSPILYGLDAVEVSDNQRMLSVTFLGNAPPTIRKENVRITGGRRITDIHVVSIAVQRHRDPTVDDTLQVNLDKYGDFSIYTLSLVALDENGHPTGQPMDRFDPRYDSVDFTFKANCPSDLDCKSVMQCPPQQHTEPDINYLAKDYASFRQLILDRLAVIMPGWRETHVPDVGIVITEILAYVGDYLSYYQDAVATEAYFKTARQRISVRRHARLVDYRMHEGCNARAWVTIWTDTDFSFAPAEVDFITYCPGLPQDRRILSLEDLLHLPAGSYEVFEPLLAASASSIKIYAAHSKISFYTWGDCECCLAPGATSATLSDKWVPAPAPQPRPALPAENSRPARDSNESDGPPETVRALHLQVGDVLIFEEVLGPNTANPADANPQHRQAVRLTSVKQNIDPLYHPDDPEHGQPIVEIEWAAADALTFPLCISAQAPPPDCSCLRDVSVALGNVILVDNGEKTGEELGLVPKLSSSQTCPTKCHDSEIAVTSGLFRPSLTQLPLTFSEPITPGDSANALGVQNPRLAIPWVRLTSVPPNLESSGPLFLFTDVADPTAAAQRLRQPPDPDSEFLRSQLSAATRAALTAWDGSAQLPASIAPLLIADLQGLLEKWTPKPDLLQSGSQDRDFVAEMDNDGIAHLRFGDGRLGQMPDAGAVFRADYRIENGTPGNVGAEAIAYILFRKETVKGIILRPRNPLAAAGATDRERMEDVKLFAPGAFKTILERAITAQDYAELVDRDFPASVQRASADLRWTGSWYEALVTVDPHGSEAPAETLLESILKNLYQYRRISHDLIVKPAKYVPLDLELDICVAPDYLQGHVEAALLDAFSDRVLPNGRHGFFYPDNLTFGQPIYLSRIIAAAQAVPGVRSAKVAKLERLFEGPNDEVARGVLQLGPFEIGQLDNDPDFPETGRLVLQLRGGR